MPTARADVAEERGVAVGASSGCPHPRCTAMATRTSGAQSSHDAPWAGQMAASCRPRATRRGTKGRRAGRVVAYAALMMRADVICPPACAIDQHWESNGRCRGTLTKWRHVPVAPCRAGPSRSTRRRARLGQEQAPAVGAGGVECVTGQNTKTHRGRTNQIESLVAVDGVEHRGLGAGSGVGWRHVDVLCVGPF